MTDDSSETREQGIEFGSLTEDLESESYPLTHKEIRKQYGEHTIEFADGSSTLGEILDLENEREFEDPEGVRQAIFAMIENGAVGRKEYSDRGGSSPDNRPPDETDSL